MKYTSRKKTPLKWLNFLKFFILPVQILFYIFIFGILYFICLIRVYKQYNFKIYINLHLSFSSVYNKNLNVNIK